jgi:type II secretory ATPase GspE/PulE/Tfp pilus assembly ATPase PilB-like protein
MKCPKCNGRGTVTRGACSCRGAIDCYVNGCNEPRQCKRCYGIGYVGMEAVRELLIEIREVGSAAVKAKATRALKEFQPTTPAGE